MTDQIRPSLQKRCTAKGTTLRASPTYKDVTQPFDAKSVGASSIMQSTSGRRWISCGDFRFPRGEPEAKRPLTYSKYKPSFGPALGVHLRFSFFAPIIWSKRQCDDRTHWHTLAPVDDSRNECFQKLELCRELDEFDFSYHFFGGQAIMHEHEMSDDLTDRTSVLSAIGNSCVLQALCVQSQIVPILREHNTALGRGKLEMIFVRRAFHSGLNGRGHVNPTGA
jgi:hypothetical protein